MPEIRRGTLLSFDSSTWLALVLLDGSEAESQIPVGQWVEPTQMVASSELAVLVFGDTNTDDAVVLGAYGSVGGIVMFTHINVGAAAGTAAGVVNVGNSFKVVGNQVVAGRATGWAAWTGTPTRTSKATGAATLANVAEALKALIDDLMTHGLIGS